MFENPRSVELDKSLTASDEEVPVCALLNPPDQASGNRGLESIAIKAVEPCASSDPQCAIAAEVETVDLISSTRARMIEDR
jgi:hypothetical protein